MRRALLTCAIALAATATIAQAAVTPPRAALTGFACHQAANPLNREIAVTAVMRPLQDTQRMALRFELQRRVGTSPFVDVKSGDLGKWINPSNPTLGQQPGDVWRINKLVVNLMNGVYRFRVTFRWTGASGLPLGKIVRLSPRCTQG